MRERLQLTQRLDSELQQYTANDSRVCSSGVVYLDCRGLEIQQFNDTIANACQQIQKEFKAIDSIDPQSLMYCRMLHVLLQFKSECVYSLDGLFKIVVQSSSDYYLPETKEKLSEALCYLHRVGLMMLIETPTGSWVVTHKVSLRVEVNQMFFSQASFKKNQASNNTGQLNYY